MIRIFHVYFASRTLLLAISEALLITLALITAMFAVFGADAGLALRYQYELIKIFLAIGVCMLCMHYYDLYDSIVLHSPGQMTIRIVQVLGTVCLILAFLYYVSPMLRLNRDLLIVWVFLAGVCLVIWRRIFIALNRSARLVQKTLLVGAGPLASVLAREIESRPELGLSLVGYVDQESGVNGELQKLNYLGGLDDLGDLLERHGIQRVVVTMKDRRELLPVESLLDAKAHGIIVHDGSKFYEAVAGRVDLSAPQASSLRTSDRFRVAPTMLIYKRAASIALSSAGLLLILPIMALIAILIRLDSRGPAIFRQKRVGKNGRPFILYKFRTMRDGADSDGQSKPALDNDDRITRVGRWLRRTRLDELPQLLNIFRGDMYLIGPRPFAMDMEEELAKRIPNYSIRWAVKPGATGWAQVRRGYNATLEDNIEKLSFDLYYIKNLSVGLDFLILLETTKILLLGRGGR